MRRDFTSAGGGDFFVTRRGSLAIEVAALCASMSVGFLRIIQIRLFEQNDTLCVAPECFYRGSMLAVEKDIRNKILFLVKMDPRLRHSGMTL
ncbi:MAG: hypothetical protein FWC57_03180, partial [Endomicrobia bacterium]|nr:hypothetical protein [Endomicrobiia bacterium]